MTRIPITRASTLLGYVHVLRAIGAPVDAALRRVKLPTLLDECPDAWISFERMQRFVADAATREGIPDLGVRAKPPSLDRAMTRSFLDGLFSAPTLYRALQCLPGITKRHTTHVGTWIASRGDQVQFCVSMPLPPGTDGHTVTEVRTLLLMEQVVAGYAGPDFVPTRRLVSSRRDELNFDLEAAHGGVPVATAQPYGAIEFPASLLRMPRLSSPPRHSQADCTPDTVAETLTACLEPYLLDGCPSIHDAASLFGFSVRTLQRELAVEGLTYRRLVDKLRHLKALAVLRDGPTDLTDLALRLGYSDETAFSRAFRRWAGFPPSAYQTDAGKPDVSAANS